MARLTREEMVVEIIEAMENWDEDTLMMWAKDHRATLLAMCTDKEILETYISDCNSDNEVDDTNTQEETEDNG